MCVCLYAGIYVYVCKPTLTSQASNCFLSNFLHFAEEKCSHPYMHVNMYIHIFLSKFIISTLSTYLLMHVNLNSYSRSNCFWHNIYLCMSWALLNFGKNNFMYAYMYGALK